MSYPSGGGYQVDGQVLRSCAQSAGIAEQSVDLLAQHIRAALALGAPGGLDIGVALGEAQEAWSARLTQLAGEAAGIASALTANAVSYEQSEAEIRASFMRRAL